MIPAKPEDILAFTWSSSLRDAKTTDEVSSKLTKIKKRHCKNEFVLKSYPKPFNYREFHNEIIWKVVGPSSYAQISYPTFLNESRSKKKARKMFGNVAARMTNIIQVSKISESESKVCFFTQLNAGGGLPGWLQTAKVLSDCRCVTNIQIFFMNQKKLVDLNGNDGALFGELFTTPVAVEAVLNEKSRLMNFRVRFSSSVLIRTFVFPRNFADLSKTFECRKNMLSGLIG